jgi:hypothetical protein
MNKKSKSLAWTSDMLKVIAKNYKTKTAREIAVMLNEQFGTKRTAINVQRKGNQLGFNLVRG